MTSNAPCSRWMLYGANGFTGRLVAQRAADAGESPIIAGRNERQLREMSSEFGFEMRVVSLDDPQELRAALHDIAAVAHCAGPFSRTSKQMVDACLIAGTHYLDITGEIAVLEAVLERDDQARRSGVVLMPGAGFDVVPTDCLAALAFADVPGATQLEIAFQSSGGISRGTARSAAEGLGTMSLCRVDGKIVEVPSQRRGIQVAFNKKTVTVTAISWGDVATAYRSTGVENIFVYTALPTVAVRAARLTSTLMRVPGFRTLSMKALSWGAGHLPNPRMSALDEAISYIWVRATASDGHCVIRRMRTPNGYSLTADSVVQIVQAILRGEVGAGAHTPSQALGANFATTLDGVELI